MNLGLNNVKLNYENVFNSKCTNAFVRCKVPSIHFWLHRLGLFNFIGSELSVDHISLRSVAMDVRLALANPSKRMAFTGCACCGQKQENCQIFVNPKLEIKNLSIKISDTLSLHAIAKVKWK